jgi:uncharacterized protein YqgC (DUF456 family)
MAQRVVEVTEPANTIVLALTLLVMVIGLIGTVLPIIPGTILIFLAALIYALIEGFQTIGWPTLVALGVMTAVATTADLWASSVGAKIGGASGWSVLVGLLGVLLTEIVRVGDWRQALKAGSGWLVGWILSTVFQLGMGLIMMAIFVWQVLGET